MKKKSGQDVILYYRHTGDNTKSDLRSGLRPDTPVKKLQGNGS